MKLLVWVNRDPDAPLSPSSSDAGVGWEHVGSVDSSTESKLVEQVQARLGVRSTRSASTDFFLSGDPAAGWIATVDEMDCDFALAVDPLGDGRYIPASRPARIRSFARRAPEPHPGRLVQPLMIPIHLTKGPRGLFDRAVSAMQGA